MSGNTASNDGLFGAFPYETVIMPATIAGLVVTIALYLLSVALSTSVLKTITPALSLPIIDLSLESFVITLIASIAMIGFFVAVLAILVSGARTDVLLVGAILTYVAGLLSILLASIYLDVSLDISPSLLISPLSPVILAVGIGIGVNWIGVDVSL